MSSGTPGGVFGANRNNEVGYTGLPALTITVSVGVRRGYEARNEQRKEDPLEKLQNIRGHGFYRRSLSHRGQIQGRGDEFKRSESRTESQYPKH